MIIKKKPATIDWHKWFAWFPVSVSKDEIAWLQFVQRRGEMLGGYDGYYWFWEYRKLQ